MTGILATAKHKLSNARIEATNNKIKLIIRRAYGFRNTDNRQIFYLECVSKVTNRQNYASQSSAAAKARKSLLTFFCKSP